MPKRPIDQAKDPDLAALPKALEKARRIAYERAIRHGTKIVIWRDGKIVEIDPKEALEKEDAA